jgi:hypothetical protein
VSAGALKVHAALEPPKIEEPVSEALRFPPVAHALVANPWPDATGDAAHPAAAFGRPLGPLHEKTV